MGLNEAIEAAVKTTAEGDKTLCRNRHEKDKVLEALPELVKAKQRKLKKLTEEYRLRRAALGQEINDINNLINKIRNGL